MDKFCEVNTSALTRTSYICIKCSCFRSTGRPLGDYINHYETLNYDTALILDQHNRVRRSSPNSDLVIKLTLKSSQR